MEFPIMSPTWSLIWGINMIAAGILNAFIVFVYFILDLLEFSSYYIFC